MIIRTNLYAERMQERRAREFSPAKIIAAGVVLILLLAFAQSFLLRRSVAAVKKKRADVVAHAASVHKDLLAARERSAELAAKVAYRKTILKFAGNRIVWAPIMERVLATVPHNVELSTFSAFCPGEQECTVRLEGKIAAKQPRLDADKFRVLLLDALSEAGIAADAKFINLEDTEKPMQINGVSYSVADFVIELTWKHVINERQST